MNDAEKLQLLADWFDKEQHRGRWDQRRQVQSDLRDMAMRLNYIGGDIPQPDSERG